MSVLEQEMPASIDAERAILGAVLLDRDALDQIGGLALDAFSLDSHRRILAAMRKLQRDGHLFDSVSLIEQLRERRELEAVGGAAYISGLPDGIPRRFETGEHVRIVREKWMRRRIVSVCSDFAVRAMDQGEEPAQELVSAADQALLAITADSQDASPTIEGQSVAEFERMERQRAGAETMAFDFGIASLDRMVGGIVPQELTVLAGRTGQGKTCLTVQLIERHCRRGIPTHAIELEMTAGQLLRRLWAIVSGVPFHKIRHPERQSVAERELVLGAMTEVSSWPLVIDDVATLTIDQVVSRARIAKRKQGTRILIVDYLQRLRFAGKPEHRYLAVGDASQQIARLAKEENLAVLVLSSLTEKGAKGRNDPPSLSDIRQSGDVQYESHCVLLCHRGIDSETEELEEQGEIIIAKSRSDKQGCVRVRFDSDLLRFRDAATR